MEKKNFGYSPEAYRKFKKNAWIYLLMFSFLYCTHYCCRLNLANVSTVMREDLGWSTSEIGIITGTLFWTYGFGHLINGRLSEIFGPHRFVVLAVILSILSNLLMGFQSSLIVMAIIWGFNGYFQSMAWSPGIATLTSWWPGSTRGFATGFAHAFSGFGQVAATLSVALSLAVLPSMGWRAAFIIPPLFPLVMLILFKLFAKPTPKSIGLEEYTEQDPEMAKSEAEMAAIVKSKGKLYPYLYVLSNRRFIVWMIVAFATGLARYGLVTWIPTYFTDVYGIDIKAGLLQSLALPVGMGIGTLVVPWLTDRFCPNNRLSAAVVASVVGAAAVYVFYLLDPTVPVQLFIIELLLFVAGFCIYAVNGTAWAYATDIGGRVFSGTSAGVLDFAAYMGAAVQSVVYGFLLESGGWNIVFLSISAFCLLIAVLGVVNSTKDKKAAA